MIVATSMSVNAFYEVTYVAELRLWQAASSKEFSRKPQNFQKFFGTIEPRLSH